MSFFGRERDIDPTTGLVYNYDDLDDEELLVKQDRVTDNRANKRAKMAPFSVYSDSKKKENDEKDKDKDKVDDKKNKNKNERKKGLHEEEEEEEGEGGAFSFKKGIWSAARARDVTRSKCEQYLHISATVLVRLSSIVFLWVMLYV